MDVLEGQTDPSELRAVVEDRLEQLQNLPSTDLGGSRLSVIRGADVVQAAGRAIKVRPNNTFATDLPGFESSAVFYIPNTPAIIDTTRSRLLRLNQTWNTEGISGGWKRRHEIEGDGGPARALIFLPPDTTSVLVTRKKKTWTGIPHEVPPLATKVRGEGVVVYQTGESYNVHGEATLLRPTRPGVLGIRRGSVHATFYSKTTDEPPQAKIGPVWTDMSPQPVLISAQNN